jgi:hypothetical protein
VLIFLTRTFRAKGVGRKGLNGGGLIAGLPESGILGERKGSESLTVLFSGFVHG